jgi:hypothetical protein
MAARALAEKTRLDPPPEGFEWSLGWENDGRRAPLWDRLVPVEELAPGGLHFGDTRQPGYSYPASGPGVREDLIDAAMERLASLLGVTEPAELESAATAVLADAGTTASGYPLPTPSLLRIVISAALEKLAAPGS